jgi:hypothetical protein
MTCYRRSFGATSSLLGRRVHPSETLSWLEEVPWRINPDLDALAIMSEDFPAYGFEKIMPWAPKAAGDLHVPDFKQILTYTDLGKLASPDQNMLDQWTQADLDSLMADNYHMTTCLEAG